MKIIFNQLAVCLVVTAVLMNTAKCALRGPTYRAAVLEHAVVFPYPWATDRTTALAQMMVNLRIYEEFAHTAGKKVSPCRKQCSF